MNFLRGLASAAFGLPQPPTGTKVGGPQKKLSFASSPLDVAGLSPDAQKSVMSPESGSGVSPQVSGGPLSRRKYSQERLCLCPCGFMGNSRRLSTVPHVRHQQLNALGLTKTMRDDLKHRFVEKWRGGVLINRNHDVTVSPIPTIPGTPSPVWRLGVIADKHFEGVANAPGERHIPTMRYCLRTCNFVPVERVVSIPGVVKVCTPVTPQQDPLALELGLLTDIKKRRRMSESDIADSVQRALTRVTDLQAAKLELERKNTALEEKLAVVVEEGNIPRWRALSCGAYCPDLRFEHVELSRAMCERLFGFPGPVLRALHDLLEYKELLSSTPFYTAELLKGIVSMHPGAVRVATAATTTAETFLQGKQDHHRMLAESVTTPSILSQ